MRGKITMNLALRLEPSTNGKTPYMAAVGGLPAPKLHVELFVENVHVAGLVALVVDRVRAAVVNRDDLLQRA